MSASIAITKSYCDVVQACFKTVRKELTKIFPTRWSTVSHKVNTESYDMVPRLGQLVTVLSFFPRLMIHCGVTVSIESYNILYKLVQLIVAKSSSTLIVWSAGCDTYTSDHTVHKSRLAIWPKSRTGPHRTIRQALPRHARSYGDHSITYLPWAQCYWAISRVSILNVCCMLWACFSNMF